MKSLLKEFTGQDLAKSDGSDAGKHDVKKGAVGDVKFSLMRNTINADGKITGSDVANYLEKAGDINDEVETVVYGLETDDGEVVKVYVNATQAEAFEAEMKKMLGMEDDIEEAINELATKFDIVDVIWPKGQGPAEEGEDDVDMDSSANIGDPDVDAVVEPEDDDEMEVIAASDDAPDTSSEDDAPPEDEAPVEEEEAEEEEAEEEEPAKAKPKKAAAKPEEEETPAPKKGDKHSKLSNVGSKMKVKEAAEAQGDNMSIGNKFLSRVLAEEKLDEAGKSTTRDRDGDGYDITLDAQQQAMVSKLRYPLPKKIIMLFSLIGVPGNKLNSAGAVDSVADASEVLRTNMTVRRAFNSFFDLFATAMGKKIAAEPKPEAVQEGRLKRGNFLQKQLETVLVKLGMPESLVSVSGPGIVGTALYKASKVVEDNAELKAALRMLAVRLGIKPSDSMAELGDEPVTEATTVGTVGTGAQAAQAPAVRGPAPTEIETETLALLAALGIDVKKLPGAVAYKMQMVQRGDKNAGPTVARLMRTLTAKLSMRGRDLQ